MYAILVDKNVIPVEDIIEWAEYFENIELRRVKVTELPWGRVSTLFLGMDHGFGGRHLWFETMIFGGKHNHWMERYETYEEAEEGHKKVLKAIEEKDEEFFK